jgi:ABC-type multidrug transport system fused ATPase/permease subunit
MSKLFNFYLLFEKDEKKKFLSIFFIIFAISLVDVLSVGATIPFLLALTHTKESSNYVLDFLIQNSIFSTSENLILHTFFIVLFFFILKTIFVFYLIYFKNNIFRFFFISLSNRIMRSYMFAPYEKFIEINSSKMINSLNKEIELLINGAINPFIILILEAITIFFILCFAAYLNIFLFLILSFFVIFLIFFFKIFFGSKLKSLGIERLNNQQLVQQNLIQGFHGIKDIKLLNKENFFITKFSEKIEKIGNS